MNTGKNSQAAFRIGWKPFGILLGMAATSLSLISTTTTAQAQSALSSKTDSYLTRALQKSQKQGGWTSVIARTAGLLNSKQKAELRKTGATVVSELSLIQSLELRVPTKSLSQLVQCRSFSICPTTVRSARRTPSPSETAERERLTSSTD